MTTLKMCISAVGIAIAMSKCDRGVGAFVSRVGDSVSRTKSRDCSSEVTINFDAPIEKLFAKLEVTGADGKNETADAPQISEDGRRMSVRWRRSNRATTRSSGQSSESIRITRKVRTRSR